MYIVSQIFFSSTLSKIYIFPVDIEDYEHSILRIYGLVDYEKLTCFTYFSTETNYMYALDFG